MRTDWLPFALENVPRYTSYPTAVAFSAEVTEHDGQNWAANVPRGKPVSVYVHTPFCEQLCWYCGCHTSVPNGYGRVTKFVDRLLQEVDLWQAALGAHSGAERIHFGGGTPNMLTPADFARILAALQGAFGFTKDAEIAVELDPRTLSQDFIDVAIAGGVNRSSLGVQDFDLAVQKAINRVQPFDVVQSAADRLRAAGIAGLNFDLVYGLPLQTVEGAAQSAQLAASLSPDRIAVFGYAHVPWFKKHQTAIHEADLPDVHARFAQAEAIRQTLEAAGYLTIGLDHYAKADDPLAMAMSEGRMHRNFQGYTVDACDTLIGLGPSSISAFAEGFVQSSPDMRHWHEAVEAGRLPLAKGVKLTPEDRLRSAIIEQIMCHLTVDVGALCQAMCWPVNSLDEGLELARALVPHGLCSVAGRVVRVPSQARLMSRTVARCFDARAQAALATGQTQRHAKAV
jgi:oxygen-independent coproporphyrinogen-3 oxidase